VHLAHHLHQVGAPATRTLRNVLDLAQILGTTAFDSELPLWESCWSQDSNTTRPHSSSRSTIRSSTELPGSGSSSTCSTSNGGSEGSPHSVRLQPVRVEATVQHSGRCRRGRGQPLRTGPLRPRRRGLRSALSSGACPVGARRMEARPGPRDDRRVVRSAQSAAAGPPPTTLAFGSMLKGRDFVATSMPGPPFESYVAGARVIGLHAFAPTSGRSPRVRVPNPRKHRTSAGRAPPRGCHVQT
jgi:hypothetical protein